jgi:hypothetical protein
MAAKEEAPESRSERRRRRKESSVKGFPIQKGETIVVVGRPGVASTWYKYLLTLGLYNVWRKRDVSVLTNRRVFTGRGVVSRQEQSTPLPRIQDSSYFRRGLAGYCNIVSLVGDNPRRQRVGPLTPRTARRFAREIADRG